MFMVQFLELIESTIVLFSRASAIFTALWVFRVSSSHIFRIVVRSFILHFPALFSQFILHISSRFFQSLSILNFSSWAVEELVFSPDRQCYPGLGNTEKYESAMLVYELYNTNVVFFGIERCILSCASFQTRMKVAPPTFSQIHSLAVFLAWLYKFENSFMCIVQKNMMAVVYMTTPCCYPFWVGFW